VGSLLEDLAVPVERLRRYADPNEFSFETTEEVQPLEGTIGQPRAVNSLEFGLQIDTQGYNMFVCGISGSGRSSTVRTYVQEAAAAKPTPSDWCYVENFRDPDRPNAIELPAGKGAQFAREMSDLVEAAKREIPRAFESENYEQRRQQIARDIQAKREKVGERLNQEARIRGFAVEATPAGIVTVPLAYGQPLTREQYEHLTEEQKEELRRKSEELEEIIAQVLREGRILEKEQRDRLRELDREVALFVVGPMFREIEDQFKDFPEVIEYLRQVREDLPEHLEDFRQQESAQPVAGTLAALEDLRRQEHVDRYKVNVIVDNRDLKGAPVIIENNPTYYNLLGRVDYRARFGAMVTDFNQIKAGALHRANGGYLIVQARDVLTNPFAWEGLKRALRSREVRIENMGEQLSIVPTASLRPEPIPIDVRVIMIGPSEIYYLLYYLDEDFRKLFKVKVDFRPDMPRNKEHAQEYAAFIARLCRDGRILHFDRTAVAKVVEYGSRLLEDQDKLSTRFMDISNIVAESSFWASKAGSKVVKAEHVDEAIRQREYRSSLPEEYVQELISEGTVLIDTEGAAVGQLNGLSISQYGDYYFGRPSRITARTFLGSSGLINIERETRLGGRIYNKGFMVLSGFLAGRFAQDKPLALSASITFEQVYDEIEGDSASSAELYTLLSSLSGLPLRQGIAVTGSVNQHGQVQAIGGVTRKIEGFFAVCQAKGLTGEQGVIIPQANVKNLMLKEEVVEAVRQGKFHIWAVSHVDQGIEILTGVPAGERQPDGSYPEGTVNYLVDRTLNDYARRLREFGTPPSRLTPPMPSHEAPEGSGGGIKTAGSRMHHRDC